MRLTFIFLVVASALSVAFTSVYSEVLKKHSTKYFTFYAPEYMEVTDELNSEASLQLSYVESIDGEVHELYAIVLFETKKQIASYELGYELHAKTYWDLAVASLEGGLSNYKVLTKDPQVELINGKSAVRSEMYGELGDVKVHYKLAVVEGKKAFYQVLTWTIEDQLNHFSKDMDKMLSTFVGK